MLVYNAAMGISDFVNDNEDKPFHSSGYAEVAHGSSIGSTSSESFAKRHKTEQNRQHIRRYSDSSVARGAGDHLRNEIRHRLEGPDSLKSTSDPRYRTMNRQTFNSRTGTQPASGIKRESAAPPKRGFSEPPGRPYNPYS